MPSLPRTRLIVLAVSLAALVAIGLRVSDQEPEKAELSATTSTNPITPGNFAGKGFDQCEAPSQAKMTAWRKSSPYRAVGIYISGSLRYCQAQTNLTPTWISTQLSTGWRLLPIHLGAQASCTTRDRYQKNKISADPADDYAKARAQGRAEADVAVAAAQRLGIVPASTIFYDLEAFSIKVASCRISSLKFLSAWTNRLTARGYTSGVYSSAASGIKALDDARVTPGNTIAMPYHLWIADWDEKANTSSTYIRPDGWQGRRIKQYRGGHNETWGGVTINIDNNYLDLRTSPYTLPGPATPEESARIADPRCTAARNNRPAYRMTNPSTRVDLIPTLQCVLKQRGYYSAEVTGTWNAQTTFGVRAFQKRIGHRQQTAFSMKDWTSLLVAGNTGSYPRYNARGADVIRIQRALNAAGSPVLTITGIYDLRTMNAVGDYQERLGLPRTRTMTGATWAALRQGRLS